MQILKLFLSFRKRYLYCVACPDGGPGISSPAIIDPSGLFVK